MQVIDLHKWRIKKNRKKVYYLQIIRPKRTYSSGERLRQTFRRSTFPSSSSGSITGSGSAGSRLWRRQRGEIGRWRVRAKFGFGGRGRSAIGMNDYPVRPHPRPPRNGIDAELHRRARRNLDRGHRIEPWVAKVRRRTGHCVAPRLRCIRIGDDGQHIFQWRIACGSGSIRDCAGLLGRRTERTSSAWSSAASRHFQTLNIVYTKSG